ncbi:hypothetical protein TPHA_0N01390 [Tetrapisispora phaffii CBS 4417]|uniref:Striatin N-terminal domain-containing protein n=1 Tax=Tetrapisispora phaffii (strain ATCC 24235 / CBS 4417 / NBRC 1672 / NRRL Y-8282 / UCD 70-5) TaxID=1071381 RepID=G8C192_TETPH|nr:hypothetical protein TPHA_0N01390 [Tetrapisispora phaffii CBS 4417]CCE65920.1 hypothetical protein TPHA_0N01390 [Tetrapisispora phaffii CBS 4417]
MTPPLQHVHPQYSLPGIMHYLQTEFTKNERDRISWELEKFEMKARIAHLEGENRDLRRRLNQVSVSSSSTATQETIEGEVGKFDPKELTGTRQAIQENVKEIIYLLKNTDADILGDSTSKLKIGDKLHYVESINANTGRVGVATGKEESTRENPGNAMQTILASPSLHRIDTMKVTADNSIIISGDNHLEMFKLDPQTLAKTESTVYNGAFDNTLDVFVSKNNILSIHEDRLQSWVIDHEDSMDYIEFKGNFEIIKIELLKAVEFKNDWLLLVTNYLLQLSKLSLPSESNSKINIESQYVIEKIDEKSSILGATLGMTEKSVIVLYNNPTKLVIYDFQGNVLQTIDLSNSLKSISQPLYTLSGLYINKETSKLLIQVDRRILIYSLDQKKIILNETLSKIPLHVSYKFSRDLIAITYSDHSVEIRNVDNFHTLLYSYGSLDDQLIVDLIIINNSPIVVINTWDNKVLLHKLVDPKKI